MAQALNRILLAKLAACLGGGGLAAAVAPPPVLPVGDFTALVTTSGVALSPDGRTLAYEFGDDHDRVLVLRDWSTGKLTRIGANAGNATPVWVNARRVVFGLGASVDVDGGNLLTGVVHPRSILFHRFEGARGDEVLALRFDPVVMGRYQPYFILPHPRIERVDTRRGTALRAEDNPGQVTGWMVDAAGTVKIAVETDGIRRRVLFRGSAGQPWRVPKGLDWAADRVRPQWLSGDGRKLHVGLVTAAGTWGIHAYDLEREEVGELIVSHDRYDLAPFATPVLAPKTRALLGVQFLTDKPGVLWFEPQLQAVQEALDASLPGMVNRITSLSDDLQRLIVHSSSPRDPGTFYQFDLARKELKPLYPVRPWIKPAQMAEMFTASYAARDGVIVRGYLTVPAGREPRKLPLVVLLREGLWTRDTWGFHADGQFLANRGYAVLQVNHRGSMGYGQEFYERGKRRIGREVQQDITDGVRWAIEKGIADPARIGIMGEGFGGFSALHGVAENPGLYRCAISIDGVTDWPAQLEYTQRVHAAGYETVKDHFGDPQADAAELAAISPVRRVAELSAPVLAIFGNAESVPREGARAYLAALKAAGRAHDAWTKFDSFEGLQTAKVRTEMLTRIEKFLAQHMPADPVAAK